VLLLLLRLPLLCPQCAGGGGIRGLLHQDQLLDLAGLLLLLLLPVLADCEEVPGQELPAVLHGPL